MSSDIQPGRLANAAWTRWLGIGSADVSEGLARDGSRTFDRDGTGVAANHHGLGNRESGLQGEFHGQRTAHDQRACHGHRAATSTFTT